MEETDPNVEPEEAALFGVGEGPHDLAARSEEIFAEIMDEKYKPRSK